VHGCTANANPQFLSIVFGAAKTTVKLG
jgi:hypothetical protein